MDLDELGQLYCDGRTAFIELLRSLNADQMAMRVVATPEWTVKQVLGHLSGIVEDAVAGNMQGVTTEPWTAAQVERGETRSAEELLQQWENLGAVVDQVITMGSGTERIVIDLTSHEHDVRGALNLPGNRDSAAVRFAQRFVLDTWEAHCVEIGLEPVNPSGDQFELFRARMGRRSLAQIEAMFVAAESTQPSEHARAFAIFGPADVDIVEPG